MTSAIDIIKRIFDGKMLFLSDIKNLTLQIFFIWTIILVKLTALRRFVLISIKSQELIVRDAYV